MKEFMSKLSYVSLVKAFFRINRMDNHFKYLYGFISQIQEIVKHEGIISLKPLDFHFKNIYPPVYNFQLY